MDTLSLYGDKLSETAASELVAQNNQISDLKKALTVSQASVAIQSAMDDSRLKFLSEEAEVYQQGESLIIRLKAINFPSGGSELPKDSLGLLAKISDIAKSLNAGEIKIEGHTDSVGTSELNQRLSAQKAETVARYLARSTPA